MAEVLKSKRELSVLVENRDVYPPTSRYKDSRYFQRTITNIGLRIEPETWVPPEIPVSADDLYTKVGSGEVGRLDLVSLRVYRLSSLWWVIAFANDIIDPFEDVTVDRVLRYPPFEIVAARILS